MPRPYRSHDRRDIRFEIPLVDSSPTSSEKRGFSPASIPAAPVPNPLSVSAVLPHPRCLRGARPGPVGWNWMRSCGNRSQPFGGRPVLYCHDLTNLARYRPSSQSDQHSPLQTKLTTYLTNIARYRPSSQADQHSPLQTKLTS